MKSRNALRTLAALSLLLFVAACEPNKPKESAAIAKDANAERMNDRDDEKDADFIVNVMAANYAEIKLSQLALDKSTNEEVKRTASILKAEHTKMIAELKGYAAKNGISVPLEETDNAKKEYRNLAEQKDINDFDEKWFDTMVDNHEESIKYFEKRRDRTEDAELRNWITSTLPGLSNHLAMLKASEERLN